MSIAVIGLCVQGGILLVSGALAVWPPKEAQKVLARIAFAVIILLTIGSIYIGIRQNREMEKEQTRVALLQDKLLAAQNQIKQDGEIVRRNSEDEARVKATKRKIRAQLNALMGEGQRFYDNPDDVGVNQWTRKVSAYLRTNEFLNESYRKRFDEASPPYPLDHSTAFRGISARYTILQNMVLELKD
jgi:hypothetical protein